MSKKQVADYILDKRIGKGSYATVWKGRIEGGDDAVAVKVISRQTVTETAQLRQEVEVLRRISHPNIVRFRDLKKSTTHFYLVLEYCAGGDLSQFLRDRGRVAEAAARRFLTQIAAGLCVLHRENVLHRDLKPQNILLSDSSDDPELKIADFGFARALQPQDMAATVCGSPLYMAPEILRHEPYDAKADLWSVGTILFELLLGKPPFSGANPMQLLANIEKNDRVSFDSVQVSAEGQEFLRALLMRSPAQRLSSREFVKHPYVRLGLESDPFDVMVRSTEGVVYSNDGGSLMVPCEWCMPSVDAQAPGSDAACPRSGIASPAVASPTVQSPEGSLKCRMQPNEEGESTQFELACEAAAPGTCAANAVEAAANAHTEGVTSRVALVTRAAEQDLGLQPNETPSSRPGTVTTPPAVDPALATAANDAGTGAVANAGREGHSRGRAAGGAEEEYVVLAAQQPIAAWAKGRGPTPRAAASDFCGKLSRIAYTLEHLATRLREQSPLEALALLLRALSLLEKALNVSLAEEGTNEPLRQAFRKMFKAAESAAQQVRVSSQMPCGLESMHPPAQPNSVVFEFAVQLAKDAAVALSKGHEVGGWEALCHEKLTLALLLLDLLGSEADGEDLSTIASYTAPITQLVGKIERLGQPLGRSPVLQPSISVSQPNS